MKTFALMLTLALGGGSYVRAEEIVRVPDSCYKLAKKEALNYASTKYNNVHAKTPFYAEDYGNQIIVPVFVSSDDTDYPVRVNVTVRPGNGTCTVEKVGQ
jgi:hypothetical protein